MAHRPPFGPRFSPMGRSRRAASSGYCGRCGWWPERRRREGARRLEKSYAGRRPTTRGIERGQEQRGEELTRVLEGVLGEAREVGAELIDGHGGAAVVEERRDYEGTGRDSS